MCDVIYEWSLINFVLFQIHKFLGWDGCQWQEPFRSSTVGTPEGEKSYRENETKDSELKNRIQNMLKMGLNKDQIIYAIWNVTTNDSQYKKFEVEFRRLTDTF